MRNVVLTILLALLAFLAQRVWPWDQDPTASIIHELGSKLSPNATILLPNDSEFAAVTMRWVDYQAPTFRAAVVVACEEDVQQSVSRPLKVEPPSNKLTRNCSDFVREQAQHTIPGHYRQAWRDVIAARNEKRSADRPPGAQQD